MQQNNTTKTPRKVDIFVKTWLDKKYRYIASSTQYKTCREALDAYKLAAALACNVDVTQLQAKFKASFAKN